MEMLHSGQQQPQQQQYSPLSLRSSGHGGYGAAEEGREASLSSIDEEWFHTGSYYKSLVFGGIDGLNVTTVLIASCIGAGVEPADVTRIGLPVIIGLSIIVGTCEFLSSRSHRDLMSAQYRQHAWDYKHAPDKQIKAIIKKYTGRGLSLADAESVVKKLATTEKFFMNLLVQEDLGIQLPEDSDGSVLLDICGMVLSYAILGCLPILVYVPKIQSGLHALASTHNLNVWSISLSVALLFLLGTLKAAFSPTQPSYFYAGCEAVAVALACSLVSFLVAHQVFNNN